MTLESDLGRAIACLRGRRTQAEVAQAAGIDPGVWSLYERSRRQPREGNLAKIARSLGCTRLELEEVVWRLRCERLAERHAGAPGADAAGVLGDVLRFADRQRSEPIHAPAEAWHQELRPILQRFTAVLEDLLVFLIRARRGGVGAERGTDDEAAREPRVARAG